MSIYIIGFIISTLLLSFSNKIVERQRWLFTCIALIIPCCIAGFRAESIGTDVYNYLAPMTNAAISSDNLVDYMNTSWYRVYRNLYVSNYEIGFSLLVYVIAKVFKNIYAVQFGIQAITIIPLYIACSKLKNKFPLWLCILTYYCLIFNTSLNLMRQAIGMAFIFLGYVYFSNHEKKKCIIVTIIAVLFHTSALLGIIIYFFFYFVNDDHLLDLRLGKKRSYNYINMIIVIAIGFILIVSVNGVVNTLSSLGLGKYIGYINGELHFMPNQFISRLPIFILFLYAWGKCKNTNNNMNFLFIMLYFDLLCSQFTSVNSFGGRIALYFSQFQILTYPTIYLATKKNKFVLFLLIAYMAFYWWFYYVYSGVNATVPYVMGI